MTKRIGLVGCGTIGGFIAARIGNVPGLELVAILEPVADRVACFTSIAVSSVAELAAARPDVVIEAADADVVQKLGPDIIEFADMVVLSGSVFADADFEREFKHRCEAKGRKIFVPHGAVLGLDGIQDGTEVLTRVHIETTKKPQGFGRDDKVRTVAYEGPTRQACRMFPRNTNVHAGIAIAGLGFDKTTSTIVSDPAALGNNHIIDIEGTGFRFRIEVISEPRGLVTGAFTPVSTYNSIRRLLAEPEWRGIV